MDISVHAETGVADSVHDDKEIVESVSNDTRKSDSVRPTLEAAEKHSGELERPQRMRSGERLPAPSIGDVSVHAETGTSGLG